MSQESLTILATLFSLAHVSAEQRAAYAQVPEADAHALVRHVYRECKNSPVAATIAHELALRAEASDVSLAQWVSQIVTVYRWMEARQVHAQLREVIEYISCATEGSGLQPGHSIEWYLEYYGFERATSMRSQR